MTIKERCEFLLDHNFEESVIREFFTDPEFIDSNNCWKYICYIHQYTKLSFNFIRELRQLTWINWNSFINDGHKNYTQEEKEKMIKQFKLVKTKSSIGDFNWSEK